MMFRRRGGTTEARHPDQPAGDEALARTRSVLLQQPASMIGLAERAGLDTSHERAALQNAYHLTDISEVHAVSREIARSLSERMVEHLISDLRKNGVATEEIVHMVRSAMGDYLHGTRESIARADALIRTAYEKAIQVRRTASEAKRRLDALLSWSLTQQPRTERVRKRLSSTMRGIEKAMDMLLEDRVHAANALISALEKEYRDMLTLGERASLAVDKAVLVLQQISGKGFNPEVSKLEEILISAKILIEAEEFESAHTAANSVTYLAKRHLTESMTQSWENVCPICFSSVCPDCELKIDGAVRCHLGCECGAGYHLCCLCRHANFLCVYCERMLNRKDVRMRNP